MKEIKIKPWPEKEMFQLMVGINIFEHNEQSVTITKEFKDFWMSNGLVFLDYLHKVYTEEGLESPSDPNDVMMGINRIAIQAWIALQEGATDTWVPEISLEEIRQATICFSAYMTAILEPSGLLDKRWETTLT